MNKNLHELENKIASLISDYNNEVCKINSKKREAEKEAKELDKDVCSTDWIALPRLELLKK